MKRFLLIFSVILIGKFSTAQDMSVIAITAPVSGCSLTATENVTVNVKNVGLTDLSGVPFNLSYKLNASPAVTDAGVSFGFFTPNTTVSYTFTVPANLSVPGLYTFKAYSTLAGDINTTNDSVVGYNVTNTAASVGGTVAGGTNVCINSNSGVLTLSGHTGSILNWEYSDDGGATWVSISNTSTTQSYLNLNVVTWYRAKVQNGGCTAAFSTIAVMTIDPTTVAGSVTGTTSVCSGSNGATMTSTGRVGSILKWQYSIDGGITWIDIANTTASQTYLNLTITTRYRVQVKSGACTTLFSSAAIITVNPVTVGGIVNGGTTVCSGANSGSLLLSGQTGSVQRWEFSINGGVSWTNIANTTTTQNYLNLNVTRWFRSLVKSGTCPAAYSSPDSIVVIPSSVGGVITSAATVCSGANGGTLTLSGFTGNINYWEFSIDGGLTYTNIANTTNTENYLNLITTTIYRANVQAPGCTAVNSGTVTITVDPVTVGGLTSNHDTVCSGTNNGTITLSGQVGSILSWESSPDALTWTAIANTTSSQNYSNLNATTYYRAIVANGTCSADTSAIDTITVDIPSIGGTISASTNVCYGNNTGTLTLSGNTGNVIRWEYSIDAGINWIAISNTTSSYIYTNLTLTTIFRAIIQNGTCTPTISGTATLTVDPTSVGGTLSASTIVACGSSNSGTINLINYVGTIQYWESSTDGGVTWTNVPNTTASQSYLNIPVTTIYRVIVKSGVCSTDTSEVSVITIDPPTVGGVVTTSDTVCAGSNGGTLTLSGYTGSILNWQSSVDGGTTWIVLGNTTTTQNYNNLMITTIYRAYIKSGVCNADTSISATIHVDPASVGGTITGAVAGCEGTNGGTLTLGGYTGNILGWELSTDGGVTWVPIVNTTNSQTYLNLTATTWYHAIVQSGGCLSDTSAAAVVTVYPKPVTAFVADTVCEGFTTTFTNTSTIASGFIQFYQWDFGDNNVSLGPNPLHTYADSGTYTVTLITISNSGCLDTFMTSVLVDPLPNAQIATSGPLQFCANDSLTLSVPAGANQTYLWSTGATTSSVVVYTSGTYVVLVTDTITGCTGMDSVAATVLSVPIVSAGSDTTISLGTTVTLHGSGAVIYNWLPFSVSDPNSAEPFTSPSATTTYTLTGTGINGCMASDSVTITVVADFTFVISNALTPNGDGINDTWEIDDISYYPTNEVIIFNRNGQKVFEMSPYNNTWTGTFNGNELPDGTYYYVLKFTDSEKIYKGPVTIFRSK